MDYYDYLQAQNTQELVPIKIEKSFPESGNLKMFQTGHFYYYEEFRVSLILRPSFFNKYEC